MYDSHGSCTLVILPVLLLPYSLMVACVTQFLKRIYVMYECITLFITEKLNAFPVSPFTLVLPTILLRFNIKAVSKLNLKD